MTRPHNSEAPPIQHCVLAKLQALRDGDYRGIDDAGEPHIQRCDQFLVSVYGKRPAYHGCLVLNGGAPVMGCRRPVW